MGPSGFTITVKINFSSKICNNYLPNKAVVFSQGSVGPSGFTIYHRITSSPEVMRVYLELGASELVSKINAQGFLESGMFYWSSVPPEKLKSTAVKKQMCHVYRTAMLMGQGLLVNDHLLILQLVFLILCWIFRLRQVSNRQLIFSLVRCICFTNSLVRRQCY